MTAALFYVVVLIAIGVCAVQLSKRHGYLTYPLLVAVFYLAWLTPQLSAVMSDPFMPRDGLWAMNLMVLLSLIAVLAGWRLGYGKERARLLNSSGAGIQPNPPDSALIWPSLVLTAVTAGARLMLAGMRLDPELTSQWSGPIVIVATVSTLRVIPLFLSLVLVLRRQTPMTVSLAIFNIVLSGSFAFVDIRRGATIDMALVSLLALWFGRRIRIGLPILAAGGVAAAIFIFTVGEFRTAAAEHYELTGERTSIFDPNVWRSIKFGEATASAAADAPDIRNAVYLIAYQGSEGEYTLGARLWDDFVFRWVPAQIVGVQTKSRLMIQPDRNHLYDRILDQYNYRRINGTTSTGFGIAFGEFWYFGALIFGFYSWFAGRWWALAIRGDIWAQTIYASTIGPGLINFTHNPYWIWLSFPLLLSGLVFIKIWIIFSANKHQNIWRIFRKYQYFPTNQEINTNPILLNRDSHGHS